MTDRNVYWKREEKKDAWKTCRVSEIPSLVEKRGLMFTTWAEWDAAPVDNERDSLPALSVVRYGDLPLDFDCADDFGKARAQCTGVVRLLVAKYGVPAESLRIYLSGGKGFHVVVDRRSVGSERGHKYLPLIYKRMVAEAFPPDSADFSSIDRSLYCMKKGKMFRVANVRRSNGGMKVRISADELFSLPDDDLKALMASVRPDDVPEAAPAPALKELYASCKDDVIEIVSLATSSKLPARRPSVETRDSGVPVLMPCVRELLTYRDKPAGCRATFNEMCFSAIVPALREAGYSHAEMAVVPEVETFLQEFDGSEGYRSGEARRQHFASVVHRDGNVPVEFSCGAMRKCLGEGADCASMCASCPVLVRDYFFDAFADDSSEPDALTESGMPSADVELDSNPVLDRLLHDFVFVTLGGREGVVRIDGRLGVTSDPQVLRRSAFESLVQNLPKIPKVSSNGKVSFTSASKAWMEHPKRVTFDGMNFNPGGTPRNILNSWRGFPHQFSRLTPEEAERGCAVYRRHIEEKVCGGDRRYIDFVWSWLSDLVRNPGGKKPGTAIVLVGGKGTGKSSVAYPFEKMLGSYFMSTSSPSQVFGRFTGHLERKLLVVLEEAVWAGSKKEESALKTLITENTMSVEIKGFTPYQALVFQRFILCSNAEWTVPASGDERRFFVLRVDGKESPEYYARLYREMDNGGDEALFVWLRNYRKPQWVNLCEPPATKGLDEQKFESMDSVETWWYDVLNRGQYDAGQEGIHPVYEWEEELQSSTLYERYCSFWSAKPRSGVQLVSRVSFTRKLLGRNGLRPSQTRVVWTDGTCSRRYVLGTLGEARSAFVGRMGFTGEDVDWDVLDV